MLVKIPYMEHMGKAWISNVYLWISVDPRSRKAKILRWRIEEKVFTHLSGDVGASDFLNITLDLYLDPLFVHVSNMMFQSVTP